MSIVPCSLSLLKISYNGPLSWSGVGDAPGTLGWAGPAERRAPRQDRARFASPTRQIAHIPLGPVAAATRVDPANQLPTVRAWLRGAPIQPATSAQGRRRGRARGAGTSRDSRRM